MARRTSETSHPKAESASWARTKAADRGDPPDAPLPPAPDVAEAEADGFFPFPLPLDLLPFFFLS